MFAGAAGRWSVMNSSTRRAPQGKRTPGEVAARSCIVLSKRLRRPASASRKIAAAFGLLDWPVKIPSFLPQSHEEATSAMSNRRILLLAPLAARLAAVALIVPSGTAAPPAKHRLTPVVLFPAFHLTRLRVTVHNQKV